MNQRELFNEPKQPTHLIPAPAHSQNPRHPRHHQTTLAFILHTHNGIKRIKPPSHHGRTSTSTGTACVQPTKQPVRLLGQPIPSAPPPARALLLRLNAAQRERRGRQAGPPGADGRQQGRDAVSDRELGYDG
jgi:hypothetical protein